MLLEILLLIILIFINGVFSCSEIAFLSINKYELNKRVKVNDKRALKIVHLLEDSSSFLSAIQIAITLSGFLASAFAAESFASELAGIINVSFIDINTLTNILIIVITIVLSYFTLVFGELVPKRIGMAYSDEISYGMVNVIYFVIKVCKPFIWILKSSTNMVLNIFKIRKKKDNDEDEIKDTIIDSSLEELEKQLLLNVFEFNDITVSEVMTPSEEVICIDINDSKEDIINIIKRYKYTRFPVVSNGNIVGLLNVKDLIINNRGGFNLKNYIRKIIKINYDMIIDDALMYLNSSYEAMAMVIRDNTYIGIVTVEDIIESIIGNVFDEYDNEEE